MDWIDLAQIRTGGGRALVNAVINLRVPQNAGNLLIEKLAASQGRTLLHGVRFVYPTTKAYATGRFEQHTCQEHALSLRIYQLRKQVNESCFRQLIY